MKEGIIEKVLLLCIVIGLGACGGDTQQDNAKGDIANGKKIFETYCILCHGDNGKLQLNGAKDITVSQLSFDQRIVLVKEGKNLMTPFAEILSDTEIEDVVSYAITLKEKK